MKLSVVFITYNHEKYVEKALRSVLEQKTDFDFEVVVGEDYSTDSTRSIIEKVASEYPGKCRLLFREKNLGRPTLNVYQTTMECKGEYIAYLEGDDYWSDENKLQKQVDYLDSHPEYIACTHSCLLIDEKGDPISDPDTLKIGDLYNWSGIFTFEDYKHSGKWPGHYASVVSRNIYLENKHDYTILYRAHDFVDDALILLFLLIQGDIYRMDETMSAWRYVKKSGGTNWNSLAAARNLVRDDCYLTQTMMEWLEGEIGFDDYEYVAMRARKLFETALNAMIKHPSRDNYRFLKDMYGYSVKHVVMKDKNTTLFTFSVKSIFRRLIEKYL